MATEKVTPFEEAARKVTPSRLEQGWEAVRSAMAHMSTLEREWQQLDGVEAELVFPTLFRRINELHSAALDVMHVNEIPLEDLRAMVEGVPAAEVQHG